MKIIKGKYNYAKIFTDNVEEKALEQVMGLCNRKEYGNTQIRMMPDIHAGAGCTIGTTIKLKDKKISSNLIGYDIGCGMLVVELGNINIDFDKLDKFIRKNIPHGQNINEIAITNEFDDKLKKLNCFKAINLDRAKKSIGSLGGGNHFCEIDQDIYGNKYLVIHTGSRNLGKQVCSYYQELGYRKLSKNNNEKHNLIERLKAEGREREIQIELKKLTIPKITKETAYIEGEDFDNYIFDMKITQKYATLNRTKIADKIVEFLKIHDTNCKDIRFETIHNYIDIKNMVVRKGAISAKKGEKLLIPLNMRDGCIIGIGKGNEDWNYSAPHGAGRVLSRSKAKELLKMQDFKDSMKDVWTSSVCEETLDESPMTYKPMEDILGNINDTIEVVNIIKPIYNFKSSN